MAVNVPKNPKPIDEQISAAISKGFETVLTDMKAQNAEMLSALKDIVRASSVKERGYKDAAVVSGTTVADSHARLAQRTRERAEESAAELSQRADPGNATSGAYHPHLDAASIHPASREDIRGKVFNTIARRAEGWAYAPMGPDYGGTTTRLKQGVQQDAKGRYHLNGKFISESDAHEMVRYDSGYHVDDAGRIRNAQGRFGRSAVVAPETMAKVERRQMLAKTATDAAQSWANGEPVGRALMSMLPEGMVKAGATAAGVAEIGWETWKKVQDQAAKNREYQRYYGGSNTDQIGERLARLGNRAAGAFTMLGGDAYDELFTGAMKMGLRGERRDQYIGFGSHLMNRGASSEQAAELMKITLSTSQSLAGLATAIDKVNASAREAGMSAEAARKIFTENYRTSSQLMMGQAGNAQGSASAFTQSQVAMGHAFAEGVDYSGTMSRNLQYVNAQALGLSPAQLELMQRTTSGGYLPAMKVGEDRIRQALNAMTHSGRETFGEIVARFIKDLGREYIPERDTNDLHNELLRAGGFNSSTVRQMLGVYGVSVSNDMAAIDYAANLFTSNAPSAIAAADVAQKQEKYGKAPDLYKVGDVAPLRSEHNLASAFDIQPEFDATLRDALTDNKLGGVYTRQISSVELDLLQNAGSYGLHPDTKVSVISGGKERLVDLRTALTSFSDQISNGSAKIVSGDQDGKSVADILGLPTSLTSKGASSTSKGDPAIGEDPSAYYAERQKTESGSKETNVKLDLTDRAAAAFQVLQEFMDGKYYAAGPT